MILTSCFREKKNHWILVDVPNGLRQQAVKHLLYTDAR